MANAHQINLVEYVENVVEINSDREYWFVRTDHGTLYETFRENNFIAIGWNDIRSEDIRQSLDDDETLRYRLASIALRDEQKRARENGEEVDPKNLIDLNTQRGKVKASTIVNKLQHFYNLRRGDVVIIPSFHTDRLSFGIVQDREIYEDNNYSHECSYRKRRKIKWIAHKNFSDLDSIFYNLKKSMHAISSVKGVLEEHVDRILSDLYYKDGYGYYVIRVKKEEDIKANDLFGLGTDLLELLRLINQDYNFQENTNETIIKINVQSEGDFVFKGGIGKSVIALGLLVNLAACAPEKLPPLNPPTKAVLDRAVNNLDTLEIVVHNR